MRMLTKIMNKEELEEKDVILNPRSYLTSVNKIKELGHKFVSTSLFKGHGTGCVLNRRSKTGPSLGPFGF